MAEPPSCDMDTLLSPSGHSLLCHLGQCLLCTQASWPAVYRACLGLALLCAFSSPYLLMGLGLGLGLL